MPSAMPLTFHPITPSGVPAAPTSTGEAPGAAAGAPAAAPATPAGPAPATTGRVVVASNGNIGQLLGVLGIQYTEWSALAGADNQLSWPEANLKGISRELYDLMTKYMNAGGTAPDQAVSLEEFTRAADVIQWFSNTYGYTLEEAVAMYNNPATPMVTVDRAAVNASSTALTAALGDHQFANLEQVRTALGGLTPPATTAEIDTVIASLTSNSHTTNVSAQKVAQYLLRTRVHGSPVSGTGVPVPDETLMALARTMVLSSNFKGQRASRVASFVQAVKEQYGAAAAEHALALLLQEAQSRDPNSSAYKELANLGTVNGDGTLTIRDSATNAALAGAWANDGNTAKALNYARAIQDTRTRTETINTIAEKLFASGDPQGAYQFALEIESASARDDLLNKILTACLRNDNISEANVQLAIEVAGKMTINDKTNLYAQIIEACLKSANVDVREIAIELLEGLPADTQFSGNTLQIFVQAGIAVPRDPQGNLQQINAAALLALVRPLVTIDSRILTIQSTYIQITEQTQAPIDRIQLKTQENIGTALTTLDAIINDPDATPYSKAQAHYVRGMLLFGLARTATNPDQEIELTINGMTVRLKVKDLFKEAMYELRAAWEACKGEPGTFRQGAEWTALMNDIFGRMVNIVDTIKNTSTFGTSSQRIALSKELVQFVPNYGTGSIAVTYTAFSSSTTSAARPRSPAEYRKSIYSGIGSRDSFGTYQSLLNPVESAGHSLDALAGQPYSNAAARTVRTNRMAAAPAGPPPLTLAQINQRFTALALDNAKINAEANKSTLNGWRSALTSWKNRLTQLGQQDSAPYRSISTLLETVKTRIAALPTGTGGGGGGGDPLESLLNENPQP